MAALSRLEHKLMGQLARASKDFRLLEPGDRVMVCMSGGKDSYGMLHLLRRVRQRAPFPFSLLAVNLDQGHPGFPGHLLEGYFQAHGDDYRMLKQDTYSIVLEKIPAGKTFCSLCSRLRRGILYNAAQELGCTKIALGHHRDDILETLVLNLLHNGQLKAMPPRLRSDDGRNVVIRPLAYCAEEDLAALAAEQAFPVIPCDLCGSQENLQRKQVKRLLAQLSEAHPNVKSNMFTALQNVRPSHLLDRDLQEALGMAEITGEEATLEAL